MRRAALLAVLAATLLAPSAARAGGLELRLGVAEGDVKATSVVQAKASLTLARLAGFDSLHYPTIAWPGAAEPNDETLGTIGNVAAAARLSGLRLYLAVYNPG